MVSSFSDEFAFLSNFFPAKVVYFGMEYPTSEHAFQAAKTLDQVERMAIAALISPGQAKQAGRRVTLRSDWENIKLEVMENIVRIKYRDRELAKMLIATGEEKLVEGNYWHDIFWGKCTCDIHAGTGENHLGKILMKVRDDLS